MGIHTNEVSMGYFGPIANLPSFLVEELVARIAIAYDTAPISITRVSIANAADIFPDHDAGVYDIIFMNLFKTAMWPAPPAPRDELWNFSCGLLTSAPIRYYVCPSAVRKGLDLTSFETLDGPNTVVEFIGGGAQETVANAKFPNSQLVPVVGLDSLFNDCENGPADVIVGLPERISAVVVDYVVDSQPIATYQNTGAAFRLDKK